MNLKSLMFYSGTIAVVIGLFTVVTAYGEAHLQAANKVDGRYTIAAQALPGCLQAEQLILLVQQSGGYVNGALFKAADTATLEQRATERPSLSGHWDNQTLTLQGAPLYLPQCQGQLTLRGQIRGVIQHGRIDRAVLTGTIALSALPGEQPFSANQVAPATAELAH